MRRRALALGLGLALLASGGEGAEGQDGGARFEAEGQAVILREDEARAQERAIQSAFRNALLSAARQSVGERGLSLYRSEIEGSLLRRSHEYIRSYRVLGLEVDPGGQIMKVRLEAVVDLPAVDEVLRSLRLARAETGQVRVLFLVEERILGEGAPPSEDALQLSQSEAGAAERRLMYLFAQAGYTAVNPRAQRDPAQPGQIGAAIRGDTGAARILGSLCGCRLVVTARAVAERERDGAFVGLANARVLRVKDGAVIAIRSNQVRLGPGRARGFETVLSLAGAHLAASLLPEVRRVFPPPQAPEAGGPPETPGGGRSR